MSLNGTKTYNGLLLSDEDAVADAQVFDHVAAHGHIVANLEVLTPVLLNRLLVLGLVRDDEIVHDAFNCGCLMVKVVLMLLYALLASEVDIAIAEVYFLAILRGTKCVPLHIVVVNRCINRHLGVSPF